MPRHFPLAIISDEVSQDLDRLLAFARDFRLEGIELRSLFGRAFKDLTRADVELIGRRCREAGLKIAGCASPVFKCRMDAPAEVREHIDLFKRSLDTAVALECDTVRVFTFLRRNTPSVRDDIHRAAEHFPKLLDAVKGTNVRLGVENEYTTVVGNGTELRDFLALLEDPRIIAVWDPCNVVFMPGAGDPIAEDYPLIADRVKHVHVKDARRVNGEPPQHCVELSTGELNFPRQFEELKKRGYKGWVSLETHWRQTALSAETQHLPAGHAFSANAEPASRICMAHLARMVGA